MIARLTPTARATSSIWASRTPRASNSAPGRVQDLAFPGPTPHQGRAAPSVRGGAGHAGKGNAGGNPELHTRDDSPRPETRCDSFRRTRSPTSCRPRTSPSAGVRRPRARRPGDPVPLRVRASPPGATPSSTIAPPTSPPSSSSTPPASRPRSGASGPVAASYALRLCPSTLPAPRQCSARIPLPNRCGDVGAGLPCHRAVTSHSPIQKSKSCRARGPVAPLMARA